MGILDPLFNVFNQAIDGFDNLVEGVLNPQVDDEQATDEIGQLLEDIQPADEAGAALVDVVEEFIISDLEDQGEINPGDVEELLDGVEGRAVGTTVALGLAGSAVEAASIGQVDQQQQYIMQIVAALQVSDAAGGELEARISEGVKPALEAKVTAEHRAKFVDLQDVTEFAVRNKDADSGYLTGDELPDDIEAILRPDEPITEDNLLEQYGIRDDQLDILEEVAIREMEPEELLETPAEAGVFVSTELLEEEMDRAGVSEQVKEVFIETAERLPRTTRAYEERPVAEVTVTQLDALVDSGEVSPDEAVRLLPDLNEATVEELRGRYQKLAALPNGAPTRSQVEGGFTTGLIGLERYLTLLDQVDIDPSEHPYVPHDTIISELDGDLRRAVGLGLIDEGQYVEYAQTAGLEDSIISRLLQGEDLGDIADSRLQETVESDTLAVDTISGIGESRRQTLEAVGVETVGAVAAANPSDITDVLNVSEEAAATFIERASVLTSDNE